MRRIAVTLWTLLALVAVAPGVARGQEAATDSVETLRSEAFVAAQYSLISGAAAALQRVTARFASGSGAIAVIERERDAKVASLAAIDRDIARQAGSGSAIPAEVGQALAARRTVARDQLAAVERRIAAEFPQYAELTRPRALAIREAQVLLNPDEALLLILAADEATYVWAVTREAATWTRSEKLRGAELTSKVNALRASMQVDGARGQTPQPVSLDTRASQSFAGPATAGFQAEIAHELYRELIAPVEPVIGGKQVLLTNVTGALTALPLALLVTAPPPAVGGEADLNAVAWLSDKYALAELPSVSSLRAIRCLLITNRAQAHRGCGSSVAALSREAPRQTGNVLLAGYGAPTLGGRLGDARSAAPAFGAVMNGTLADTAKLRNLAYLPQARAELESLGRQFGRTAKIVVGDGATEAAVKASREVAGARFVVFSTHGLLAAEVGDNDEPGLVFTPPSEAAKSALDDGLLTASEAAQLKLAADLVVLSACNTAASSGRPGAEGLSGLARSFFYAGARSLLVSHWAVNDEATSLLMQRTFENIQASNFTDRARALQQAMKTLRTQQEGRFANPKYWAAFTLVGEAGK